MKKLIILTLLVTHTFGCGEGSPTTIDETPLLTNVEYVTLAEFDNYIATIRATIPTYNIMIAEFSSIAAEFNAGFVPDRWIAAYTRNLLRRVEGVQDHARRIRPTQPELLKLHLEEYEASIENFRLAFSLFVQAIERPGSVNVVEINDRIVDGNTHMIRLQILLGDLAGRNVDFFSNQGAGGDGIPEGELDGFGF